MMETKELSYSDLTIKAITLLDTDDKVRTFLMESTRILRALSESEAIGYDYECRAFKLNYWRFVLCCNLTPAINRLTAQKIYARFVGGYCEGLEPHTTYTIGMLFEELAQSIHNGESKQQQQELLKGAIDYLLKW